MGVLFTVDGKPQPQGSKVRGRFGGIHESNAALMPWRDSIIAAARAAHPVMITGPVVIDVQFCFGRPKSHYGTGRNMDLLRESAPREHTSKPDVDKLQRALGDALVYAGLLRDDSQIVTWNAGKQWAPRPFMQVHLVAL